MERTIRVARLVPKFHRQDAKDSKFECPKRIDFGLRRILIGSFLGELGVLAVGRIGSTGYPGPWRGVGRPGISHSKTIRESGSIG